MTAAAMPSRRLPCVVQVGFAGPRRLADLIEGTGESLDSFLQRIREHLSDALLELRSALHLEEHHFLCGISQIAVGADTLFTQACRDENRPQRVFLAQHRDAYLAAVGSDGGRDFSPEECAVARELLDGDHVIQVRVVSDSPDRAMRFEETNWAIVRESDAVVCLVREDASAKRGGTRNMLELAQSFGIPVLEIRMVRRDDRVVFERTWHNLDAEKYTPPSLPEKIREAAVSLDVDDPFDVEEYCTALRTHVRRHARLHRALFSYVALVIIATHIVATLLSTVAFAEHCGCSSEASLLAEPGGAPAEPEPLRLPWTFWLLAVECLLLVAGIGLHFWLHLAHPQRDWAVSRLLTEIIRSVQAVRGLLPHLGYLYRVGLPDELVPWLRTLNALYLRSGRPTATDPPPERRYTDYLTDRLGNDEPERGQIGYYSRQQRKSLRWLRVVLALFWACSLLAIVATVAEFFLSARMFAIPWAAASLCTKALGVAAIFLPVLAVGALSWAAARDHEARVETYGQMLDFLRDQKSRFGLAHGHRRVFAQLVEEAEMQLVAENAHWYSRRSFTGA